MNYCGGTWKNTTNIDGKNVGLEGIRTKGVSVYMCPSERKMRENLTATLNPTHLKTLCNLTGIQCSYNRSETTGQHEPNQ